MTRPLYHRPGLPTQDSRAPTGRTVVQDCLERAQHCLDGFQADSWSADTAYDLLALWSGFQRFDPGLLSESVELCSDLDKLVRAHAQELIREALEVPDPEAWLASCRELAAEDFPETETDPLEYSATVRTLLQDLDELELVCYSTRVLDCADLELEAGAAKCLAWLSEHTEFWLCVAAYVRAVGLSLREDLAVVDPELALTAEKFVTLLDALEQAMVRLSYRTVASLPSEVARGLVSEFLGVEAPKRRVRQISLALFRGQGLALAASSLTEAPRRVDMSFYVPELDCELVVVQLLDGQLGVEIYDSQGQPSMDLVHCEIRSDGGESLLVIRGSEGQFGAGPQVGGLVLLRDGEVLDLEPR